MSGSLFDEMKRYVGFGPTEEQHLREVAPLLRPHFTAVVTTFYHRIEEHPDALAVIAGGAEQVERLKRTLERWLDEFFTGPWVEAYYENRARIGRMHVRIGLPQHYNFTAMNVIRGELNEIVAQLTDDPAIACQRVEAIDRLLDLELAIMLHTYKEDYAQQLQRRERLATFGEMTSTIAHELRNPLGVIDSSVYLLRGAVGEDARGLRHLEKIRGQVARSNRIITSLLDIVRDRPPSRMHSTPGDLAERAAADVLERRGFAVEVAVAEGLPQVLVDPEQMHQVLVNLLDNAVDASGDRGRVRLSARAAGHGVEMVVNDDGPGVEDAVRARLFEPLVTTKDTGVGLGLALCRKVVEAHGGTLRLIDGEALPGAAFAVWLKPA